VDFIKKATLVMVVVFMLTSLTLGFFNLERPSKSIMSGKPAATQTAPAAPGAPSGTAVPQGAPTQTAPAAPAVPGK
jgi:preprotein translocase subunit SecG